MVNTVRSFHYKWHENPDVVGVDLTAADVARENLRGAANVSIRAGDLLGDLSFLREFDFIYCQDVLHHTSDPAAASSNVAARLAPGGEYAVYVYRRKAPCASSPTTTCAPRSRRLATSTPWRSRAGLRRSAGN